MRPRRRHAQSSPIARPSDAPSPSAEPASPETARPPSGPGPATDPTRPLQRWESWVDRAIREAEERGEFANLPGAGKPLALDDDPYAGEWRTAFRVLKNADMAPPWIEANREITAGRAELATLRDHLARRLTPPAAASSVGTPAPPAEPAPTGRAERRAGSWWRTFLFGPGSDRRSAPARPPLPVTPREAERLGARRRYLDAAAALDAKIAEHNVLLPDTLRRLEQPRLTPAQAARDFDAACPPTTPAG